MRRLLLIGLVCGVVLALGGAASAQSGSEAIRSYDVRIAIQKDGSLSVVEVIDYDFAKYGSSAERKRLLDRWEREINSAPR